MKRPSAIASFVLAGALCGLLGAGCQAPSAGEWVDAIATRSAAADAALAESDPVSAEGHLLDALAQPVPAGVQDDVRLAIHRDLYYRLAELCAQRDQHERAIDFATGGIELAPDARDLFAANLFVVRGRALRALERPNEAISDLGRALEINAELLSRSLDEEPPASESTP